MQRQLGPGQKIDCYLDMVISLNIFNKFLFAESRRAFLLGFQRCNCLIQKITPAPIFCSFLLLVSAVELMKQISQRVAGAASFFNDSIPNLLMSLIPPPLTLPFVFLVRLVITY
jgi:hypothetical protein